MQPVTYGDSTIHVSKIDYLVNGPQQLLETSWKTISPVERKVANIIADNLVDDGATLQLCNFLAYIVNDGLFVWLRNVEVFCCTDLIIGWYYGIYVILVSWRITGKDRIGCDEFTGSLCPSKAPSKISQQLTTQLRGHKDLGIHTECFGDGEIDLVHLGVINNRLKTVRRGRIVASYVIGTKKTFDFINGNPLVGKF